MTQDNFIDHFRHEFFQEAREILEAISDDILKLEADPENNELLNSVFRGIHTIKGSAGSFELTVISDFTHHLEGVLNVLRDGKLSLSSDLVDVILSASDQIAEMIEVCASGETPELNHALIERIVACLPSDEAITGTQADSVWGDSDSQTDFSGTLNSMDGNNENSCHHSTKENIGENIKATTTAVNGGTPALKERSVPDDMAETFRDKVAKGQNVFKIILKYTSAHFENGYDPLVFLRNLYDSCSLYHVVLQETNPVPGLKTFQPLYLYLAPIIYVASAMSMDEIIDLVFDEELISVDDLVEKPSFRISSSSTGADGFASGSAVSGTK
ncbi:MAG: Hpt domain-containing protein, partial [Desulfamplus sp.]|nr:Hpt domain-containing protein [Desulfamplus sp.]